MLSCLLLSKNSRNYSIYKFTNFKLRQFDTDGFAIKPFINSLLMEHIKKNRNHLNAFLYFFFGICFCFRISFCFCFCRFVCCLKYFLLFTTDIIAAKVRENIVFQQHCTSPKRIGQSKNNHI